MEDKIWIHPENPMQWCVARLKPDGASKLTDALGNGDPVTVIDKKQVGQKPMVKIRRHFQYDDEARHIHIDEDREGWLPAVLLEETGKLYRIPVQSMGDEVV